MPACLSFPVKHDGIGQVIYTQPGGQTPVERLTINDKQGAISIPWNQYVGLTDIISRVNANPMREESRSQMAFLDAGDILRMFGRAFKVFIRDPYSRSLLKQATGANPREFMEYMGYGLFVGKKANVSRSV